MKLVKSEFRRYVFVLCGHFPFVSYSHFPSTFLPTVSCLGKFLLFLEPTLSSGIVRQSKETMKVV